MTAASAARGFESASPGTGPTRAATPDRSTPVAVSQVAAVADQIRSGMEQVIEGKREQIDIALVVLLAGGHLLIEDVPGVGKTMLAKALGRCIDCSVHRIQFTPDLLPSDISGVSVYNQDTREFEFKPGGVFANIVVGDEINRASPKTQSALLEAMEESQVTVDSITHQLGRPFMLIATQNPSEMEGTYALPEAQRDRFMACITMGYPTHAAEVEMLNAHGQPGALEALQPRTDAAALNSLIDTVSTVHVSPAVKDYIVHVVAASRELPQLKLGGSPRASLHLLRAARAKAALEGRDFVVPDDVLALVAPVLAHRVLPTAQTRLAGLKVEDILLGAARSVKLPDRS